jgi:hypothetical protein
MRVRRPCVAAAALVSCVGFSCVPIRVYAQPPNCTDTPGIVPSEGPTGYGFRSDSDRCEGLYEQQVSGGGLQLASLTHGRISYDLERDNEIVLSGSRSELVLRGQGVSQGIQYRLDARLPTQADFRLPLAAVLRATGIDAADLGLLAFREEPDGKPPIYVPLRVTPASPDSTGVVVAVLRSESSLTDVQWRLVAPGSSSPAFQLVREAQGLVVAGQRIELDLPGLGQDFQGALEVRYRDLRGETYSLVVPIAGQ